MKRSDTTELVAYVREKTALGRIDARNAVKAIFEYIMNELAQGRDVNIPGVGKFRVSTMPPHKLYNCRTGEVFESVGAKRVSFSAATNVKRGLRTGTPIRFKYADQGGAHDVPEIAKEYSEKRRTRERIYREKELADWRRAYARRLVRSGRRGME